MIKKLKYFITVNPFSLTFYSILMLLVLIMTGIPILELIELKTYDLRFLMRGQKKPANAVVMAVIDERSLDKEGRWPWPRSKIADLIDKLNKDGAKVIGFDIGFLEPDENSTLKLINQLENQIVTLKIKNNKLADFIKTGKAKADNDMALAKSIKNSSAAVVLGYFFHTSKAGLGYEISPKEIDRRLKQIDPSKYPLIIFEDQKPEYSPFLNAYAPETNLELLTKVSDASGYFNTTPDTTACSAGRRS